MSEIGSHAPAGLPITPAILVWARTRAGVSKDHAITKFAKYSSWEEGAASPSYAQLEDLADFFKVSVAVFFFPEPPELPSIEETFRTLPQTELDKLPRRARLLLRKAKAFQISLQQLYQDTTPSRQRIIDDLRFTPNTNPTIMAARVRSFLQVPIEAQIEWKSSEQAFKEWRRSFFESGIFVFKDAFRLDEFSGFCLYDAQFPLIYVNNSHAITRQIFTLFHELAHLLFRTSGIDPARDFQSLRLGPLGKRIEVLCNEFAAQVLVPDEFLLARLKTVAATRETATELAALLNVSREVVFRKFLDFGLIDETTYEAAAAEWAGERKKGRKGGDFYWNVITYLGREYLEKALGEFQRDRISETELAEHLQIAPKNLQTLGEYFEKGSV